MKSYEKLSKDVMEVVEAMKARRGPLAAEILTCLYTTGDHIARLRMLVTPATALHITVAAKEIGENTHQLASRAMEPLPKQVRDEISQTYRVLLSKSIRQIIESRNGQS